jgi:hypothetical protein
MNHRLTQFFRAGLPPRLPKGDFMRRPVVFQNQGIIHGDIRRHLFKVTYWIATRRHHIAQQLVRFRNRTGGAVNEARLDSAPGLNEACAISRREGPNVKPLNSLRTLFQSSLAVAPVAAFLQSASVFRATELSAQFFSPPLSKQKEHGNARDEDYEQPNNQL